MELKKDQHLLVLRKRTPVNILGTDIREVILIQVTEKHYKLRWLTGPAAKSEEWLTIEQFNDTWQIEEAFTTTTDSNGTRTSTVRL